MSLFSLKDHLVDGIVKHLGSDGVAKEAGLAVLYYDRETDQERIVLDPHVKARIRSLWDKNHSSDK